MKFIHTADIHLDSPLLGLSAYQDAPTHLLRTATRDAFTRLVDEALSEEVDFLLIAGDLYDGNWKDFNTGLFFAREMGRLNRAGIVVYLLLGNHDAENEMTRKLQLPDNVFLLSARKAQTLRLDALKVAIHGRSFKEAATTENLVLTYPDPVPGYLNIGMLHTALEGNAAHANYAPCSIAELEARGYAYWALGHVHEFRMWQGASTIVFPGNLQGRHVRESGPRGAVLVTADGEQITSVERLYVDVLRWCTLEVDVSSASSLPGAVRAVGEALDRLLDEQGHNLPLAVRVVLSGRSQAHGELFGLESQLRHEVLALAAARGSERLWIEKVRLETRPDLDAGLLSDRADALADLQGLLGQAVLDADFGDALQRELQDMVGKLPLDVIQGTPLLESVRAGQLSALMDDAASGLIAHLASNGDAR